MLLLTFPVIVNSVKILSSLILLILTILGFYIAITQKQNPFKIKELKVFSRLTVGYFGVILLSMLIADGSNIELHHLGRKLQFLLAPLIALALFQINMPLKKLLLSLKMGLIIIGIITMAQFISAEYFQMYLGSNWGRPSGMFNQNIFGDIATIMLFLSITNFFSETRKEQVVTLIAISFGISAIFLSGSRGSWLSVIILSFVYFAIIYKPLLRGNNKRKILLLLFFTVAFGFISTQNYTEQKIKQATIEIQKWNSGENLNNSSGIRLQMWGAGLIAAKDSLWLGYGYRNANKITSEYATNNKRTIRNKTHLHNEYITHLVSAGIVGLVALLILLFKPMIMFYKKLKKHNIHHYASMGLLLCVSYVTFGFTHIAFGEENINAFYILFMGFLLPRITKNPP